MKYHMNNEELQTAIKTLLECGLTHTSITNSLVRLLEVQCVRAEMVYYETTQEEDYLKLNKLDHSKP